jgi:hypothetical protein
MIESGSSPIDSGLPSPPEESPLSPHDPHPTAAAEDRLPSGKTPRESDQPLPEEGSLPSRTRLRVLHGSPAVDTAGEAGFPAVGAPEVETLRRLELELTAARDEVHALHQMLEDLPEIFERKFRQRLQTVLDHQQHLLADNHALRERLYALAPAAAGSPTAGGGKPALPPALSPGNPSPSLSPTALPTAPPTAPLHPRALLRFRRTIRRVLGLGASG